MKVRELIEKLQEFDPELTVTYGDSEDGTQVVTDASLDDDAYIGAWDKATVIFLSGDYIYEEHVDAKYFRKQERPVYGKPNPILDNLKVIYDSAVPKGTAFFKSLDKMNTPNKDGFVEFKIINNRSDNEG